MHPSQSRKFKFNDLIDRLYIVNEMFDLGYIFSDSALDTANGIVAVLDKENGYKESHFRSNAKTIRLIWRTHSQEVPRDFFARGFRVLVYPSGEIRDQQKLFLSYHL